MQQTYRNAHLFSRGTFKSPGLRKKNNFENSFEVVPNVNVYMIFNITLMINISRTYAVCLIYKGRLEEKFRQIIFM